MSIPKLYRLFYGNSNDRQETFRVKAYNVDQVIEWIKTTNNLLNIDDHSLDDLISDIDGDSQTTYIMLNVCLECPYYDLTDKEKQKMFHELNGKKIKLSELDTICEHCESNEYIEITEIENPNKEDFEFKTIYGQNDYVDLTTGETAGKTINQELAKAWETSDQHGANELMYQTLKNNPKLIQGISKEYLDRITKTHRDVKKALKETEQ